MKKFVFILMLSLLTKMGYADSVKQSTLVYDKRDNSVISVGYIVPTDTTPFQGVEFLKSPIPNDDLRFYSRTSTGTVTRKTDKQIQDILDPQKSVLADDFMTYYNSLKTPQAQQSFLVSTVAQLAQGLQKQQLDKVKGNS